MKTIMLVGRQTIYDSTNKIHDDQGLAALNGIRYGKRKVIEDDADPIDWYLDMKQEFEKENPDFRVDRYAIKCEDGREIKL